jgi:spermidine/putrescine-binding protein
VIIPSDYTVTIMANQGLLEELDQSKLPNLVNIADEFKIGTLILGINTASLISGEQ